MKPWAKKFYKSKVWRDCRDGYITSVHGLCESCLSKGRVRPGLICHHKVYLTPENINDTNISLNWDNLRYDCQDCHNQEHHGSKGEALREGLVFDSNGNIYPIPPLKKGNKP